MNTVLYIDGFNLYYGCLRHSPYKWLNPAVMAGHLLPGHTITAVRYFSANISARPEALDQPIRQQMYFRALRTLPGLTIQLGYFKAHEVAMKLVHPRPNGPPTAWVWRTDEKGSDVNLATQLLVDAFDNKFECAVLVTNDSDLLAPVRAVRERFQKVVGVLNPQERPSRALKGVAHFYKKIRPSVLALSQFPPSLTDAHGTFHKPASW